MQEKVLIPLDGSKVGEAALSAIEERMTKWKSELQVDIMLLGVVTNLTHWVVVGEASAPISYTEEELNAIKQRVSEYLDKAGETLRQRGARVITRVVMGNAGDEILKVAEGMQANLIAMSTHGRSGLRRLAFGSVTDKVLRGSNVPVLVVRAKPGTINV